MSVMSPMPVSAPPATDFGDTFAIVDVETTGLRSQEDRIVQVAISQVDRHGRLERHWHTLVDPGRHPGPVHIHGITPERLRGAPSFHQVAPVVAEMLAGRVIVAHNAAFDWGFLYAESARAAQTISGGRRLCTLALARRLDLDVPDFKLATLAYWARIEQQRAHDASDDVRVLHSVFLKLMDHAMRSAVALPYSMNVERSTLPWPTALAPRINSPWELPGAWRPGSPLVQGMKFVITGGTRVPREELYRSGIAAGLIPMNAVSGRTRFLVCGSADLRTNKAVRARELGVPVITDLEFTELLGSVSPGVRLDDRPGGRAQPPTAPRGALTGCRVLVLGGPHHHAAAVREEIAGLGGRVAVNLTTSVSHLVVLPGAGNDPRLERAGHLVRLDAGSLRPLAHRVVEISGGARSSAVPVPLGGGPADPVPAVQAPVVQATAVQAPVVQAPAVQAPAVQAPARAEATILSRGWVCDLPIEVNRWELFVGWTTVAPAVELDVVAFVTDADEKVLSDEYFLFYNNLGTPARDVRLDLGSSGEARLSFDLDELAQPGVRMILGASLTDGRTFGQVGPVELTLRDRAGRPWVRAVLDAGTTETSLLLAEFYQRGEIWRLRAVGQGYEEDLAGFARRHGVDVG